MLNNKKIVVVLPAYNVEYTLEKTYNEIPFEIVDEVVFVDDKSTDNSVEVAQRLGIKHIIIHDINKGYGANQKTCYKKAMELGADIVVMLHPDYQYTPQLIFPMCHIISNSLYQVVMGSRILGVGALKGGMPRYKYVANRILTLFQNILLNKKLSEYHTGYRAFSREVLEKVKFHNNSDDFVFDNQMLAQILALDYEIAEITCPTRYTKESSSIGFKKSIIYGLGVVKVSIVYFLHKKGIIKSSLFS